MRSRSNPAGRVVFVAKLQDVIEEPPPVQVSFWVVARFWYTLITLDAG